MVAAAKTPDRVVHPIAVGRAIARPAELCIPRDSRPCKQGRPMPRAKMPGKDLARRSLGGVVEEEGEGAVEDGVAAGG